MEKIIVNFDKLWLGIGIWAKSVNSIYVKSLVAFCTFLVMGSTISFAESKDVTMQVGETKTLYLPSSVTSKNLKSVAFYSNGISYVHVESYTNYSVTVKAVKASSSPIIVRCDYYYYVSSGSYTYQAKGFYDFDITVAGETKIKPTSINLPLHAIVEVGESLQLTPEVLPANAEYTLSWSINDKSVATISNDGLLTGKSVGDADLKVQADNGVYTMCRVSVYKPKASSVSISPSSLSLKEGDTYSLSASVYPINASYTLTWSSTNENVAKVNSGRVTAVGAGTCQIKATTDNGRSASCYLTVTKPVVYPNSVSIQKSLAMEVGDSYTLSAEVLPANAEYSLTWTSSDKNVATVDNGKITAVGAGTCEVSVSTNNGKTASCHVTVNNPVVLAESVSIQTSLAMEAGDSYTLSAEVLPVNAEYSLTWTSSDKNVATVNNGKITAVGAGTCEVSVSTNNGKTASCHVTVNNPVVLAESVSIQTSLAMEVGDSYTLSAEVLPANAEYSLTWTSSDKNVATVNNGKITAVGAGTCEVSVSTNNGKTASCFVTVNAEIVDPKDPITEDWDGTYSFTSTITKYAESEIDFKEDFELTICNKDNTFFITSMLGCNTAYLIYEGLKLNIIDDANAEIVLDYNNDLGSPAEGGYYSCMHIISPESEYKYNYHQVIRLARLNNKKIKMDDFYIYAFGLETDFEYSKEVRYSNCNGEKTSGTTAIVEVNSRNSGQISIYDMNGKCVYIGLKTETPILKTGTYVIKEGNTTKKIYIK